MRLLLSLLIAAVLLPTAAHATANETAFRDTVAAYGVWANTNQWSTPIYRECVPWRAPWAPCEASHERINVQNVNNDFTPKDPVLTANWQGVMVEAGFKPAAGTDHQAVVVNYTGVGPEYTEFWNMRKNPAGAWTAVWGGSSKLTGGALRDDAGLKVWTNGQGTSASGIALYPGTITLNDLQAGTANHPIQFSVPHACVATKPPASRNPSDGLGGMDCIQYGAKYKLPASVNVDAITSDSRWCGGATEQGPAFRCPLPPIAKVILKAAQTSYLVATEQTYWGNPITFHTEGYDRPRTGNWANVPAGNPFTDFYGCDGLTSSGHWDAHPVTPQEGWEQDCSLPATTKSVDWQLLYEVP